ncbi:MAG TPA: 16S rRNA (guanine(527)-N(7))-methyltransferase RsmG [Candidatus Peribacteraceae bacterium]|nr:16S rRNA (guanine(527)-N(7))-methyltransferase RsmG [Candidatus Peribacteraceae bacterium]
MSIPTAADAQLRELMRMFLTENANINLSALRTEEACWIGNIEDSLAYLDLNDSSSPHPRRGAAGCSYIDVGTGGGFPLLPLAVALPEARFTGLDTIRKKVDAIARIAKELKLTNVETVAERAEVLGRNTKHREQYDVVLSRAVAPLNVLLEYCSPFAKKDGLIVLWKSVHIEEELKQSERAQKLLACALIKQHRYELPSDFGPRQLLVFKKTAALPDEFPRKVGMPKKEPL